MKCRLFYLAAVIFMVALAAAGCTPAETRSSATITGVVNSTRGDTILVVEGSAGGVPQENGLATAPSTLPSPGIQSSRGTASLFRRMISPG